MSARNSVYPIAVGDRVYHLEDERHVGRLRRIDWGEARVEWEETGWLSDLPYDELRRVK